jgi:hypothetical protein
MGQAFSPADLTVGQAFSPAVFLTHDNAIFPTGPQGAHCIRSIISAAVLISTFTRLSKLRKRSSVVWPFQNR